jgi:hypothetical protein
MSIGIMTMSMSMSQPSTSMAPSSGDVDDTIIDDESVALIPSRSAVYVAGSRLLPLCFGGLGRIAFG